MSDMTADQIRAALLKWDETMRECESQLNALSELTRPAPESPLLASIFGVMGAYTHLLAEQIGWSEDALTDWWLVHKFGDQSMRIGFFGEELRNISTIEMLADFIIEDLRRSAADIGKRSDGRVG